MALTAWDYSTTPPTLRELRCNASGELIVAGAVGGGGGATGGLTNTELRATPVPVSGPITDAQLRAAAVPVTGPVTDAQLRAAPVPVNAAPRACVGRQTLALVAGTVTPLTVPNGAVACDVQADGNTIRVTLNGTDPSATVGTRIDDGVIYPISTPLASVKLLAPVACNAQVVYFDKA